MYVLAAGYHFNRLIVPAIVVALMKNSVFVPFVVSFAVLLVSFGILFAVQEPASSNELGEYTAIAPEEDTANDVQSVSPQRVPPHQSPDIWTGDAAKEFAVNLLTLFRKPVLVFCLSAFFLKRVAFTSENFVYQYASERFDWQLRETAWLGFAAGAGAVFATLIANPLLNLLFSKHGYNVHKLDHAAAITSLLIVALAFFELWESSSGGQLIFGTLRTVLFHPHFHDVLRHIQEWSQRA